MARYEFKLPDIGEGVTEGEIVNWLVKVGDRVSDDQEMVEVMTDKATVTIGAPKAGVVTEQRFQVGQVVPVGAVLVVFDTDAGAAAPAPAPVAPAPKNALPPSADADGGVEVVASAVGDIKDVLPGMGRGAPKRAAPEPSAEVFSEQPLAAPATRKLARELGVDLRRVKPTGSGGRVTRDDVERASSGAKAAPMINIPVLAAPPGVHDAVTLRPGSTVPEQPVAAAAAARAPAPVAALAPVPSRPREERQPIRGMRKRIYENMARSKHTAAHFTYVDECDVTALKGLRERTKGYAERAGVKLSFLPFIVKAVVAALRKHPALNCLVDDAAGEMVLRKNFDIGIAAATESGLTVPVLRDADRLSVLDIARELERLGGAARDGKLRQEDLGGSSFTITSLGKQGGLFATPVVNYPEVAILGVHEMKRRPVVRGDDIVIGEVMLLSLSFDHRIIDGHVGAAFAQEIIALLQEPDRLLVEMA